LTFSAPTTFFSLLGALFWPVKSVPRLPNGRWQFILPGQPKSVVQGNVNGRGSQRRPRWSPVDISTPQDIVNRQAPGVKCTCHVLFR